MKTLAPSLLCVAFILFGCEKNKVQQNRPAAFEQPVTTLPAAEPSSPIALGNDIDTTEPVALTPRDTVPSTPSPARGPSIPSDEMRGGSGRVDDAPIAAAPSAPPAGGVAMAPPSTVPGGSAAIDHDHQLREEANKSQNDRSASDTVDRSGSLATDQAAEDKTKKTAEREKAATQITERLTRLDARITDLKARADRLPPADRDTFINAFDNLRLEREIVFTSIGAIRDESAGPLDKLKKASEDKVKGFEKSIDSLENRVEKGVGKI